VNSVAGAAPAPGGSPPGGAADAGERIPGFAECHFCRVKPRRRSWRCWRCVGRLGLRERFVREAEQRLRRRTAPVLSLVFPGLGHLWAGHPAGGALFFVILAIGIAYAVVLEGEFNAGRLTLYSAVTVVWVLAALDATRGQREPDPPCQEACPNRLACMRYVQLVREGLPLESLELVQLRCPTPGSIGRVCHHPCEKDCRRGREGEPIAICALKRYVSDERHREAEGFYRDAAPPEPIYKERIAIVGAGPSGVAAATVLRVLGFPVSLIDAEAEPGGMPALAIPDYRLPQEIYRREVAAALAAGVEFRPGRRLGTDFQLADLAAEGFAATYLALGAQRTVRLPHCGTAEEGFVDGLDLLRQAKRGEAPALAGEVLVIGGGNVAMDVAKTALRLGAATVRAVFLETRETMPAHTWECEEAVDEGVMLVPATATVSFERRDGRVAEALCRKVGRIEVDEQRRIRPVLLEGTDFTLPAATVITAVGSGPDFGFLPAPPPRTPLRKGLFVGRLPAQPGVAMPVLYGGDCLTGPASVIQAIAAGYQAAGEIFVLLGRARRWRMPHWNRIRRVVLDGYLDEERLRVRNQMVAEEPGDRCTSFCEICHVYPPATAVAEADRCLRCRWTVSKRTRGPAAGTAAPPAAGARPRA